MTTSRLPHRNRRHGDLRLFLTLVILTAPLLIPEAAFGQASTGSISGLVTDPSGAAVGDVAITVTDLQRNVPFRTASNAEGFYMVTPLPPGRYSVTAEKTGFRKYVLDEFPLSTAQKANVNIKLELGAVTESVQVTGEAQLIEATTSTLGTVTENKKIVDLPLNGRNIHTLVLLTPGVMGISATGGMGESYESAGRYLVNGGRDSSTGVQLDGVAVEMNSYIPGFTNYSAVPSVEGVQEFRIQTNAYSAEFGRSGGGLVTMVTKSGTNTPHGTLYEYLRNSVLDSNNFFANKAGRPLTSFKRNEFGANIGGPIFLPRIYDGRNKSFFFASYEGRRLRQASLITNTLPTDLEKAGDFSQTFTSAAVMRTIYDPFSTAPDPARPGQFLRTPFSGNKIPQSMFDPIAVNVQKLYPSANTAGLPFTHVNNYAYQGTFADANNRGTLKYDQILTDKQRMFFRYTILNWTQSQAEAWPPAPNPGCPDSYCFDFYQRQQNAALDYTNTLSNSMVLNVRYGWGRGILDRWSRYKGFKPSSLGFPAYLESQADYTVFPQFTIADMTAPGLAHHWNFRNSSNVHNLAGNVTKITGRHTLKMGAESRFNYINHMQATWQLAFSFQRAETQGPDPRVPTATAGIGYASFLLGALNSGSTVNGIRPAMANRYFALFFQDDYKITRKLTLNLGIRWDTETGGTERHDRFSIFDPYVKSPLSDKVGMNLTGGYLFYGKGWNSRAIHPTEWKKFNPRIGFAYELNSKTAIRAGYGIFYSTPAYAAVTPGPMYNASTAMVTSLDGVTPYRFMRDPFPDGINFPEGSKNGLLAAIASGVGDAVQPWTMNDPYNQQWNFTIQRSLARDLALEVAYAGNKGTHLPLTNGWQMNQLRPEQIKPENDLLTLVDNPFYGIIPSGTLGQAKVQRGQLMRPFPQYPGVGIPRPGWGNSNFHALEMKLERRFAGGTSAMVSYTWSKLISDGGDDVWVSAGYRNYYCRTCDRSVSIYNQPHRLVGNFTYELPFGKGKKFGSNWNKPMDLLLGQWQVNGIATIGSGLPLQFTVIQNTSYSFGGGQRPNSTGVAANIDNRSIDRWFDTAQFTNPAPYTFGNLGRVHPTLRGDRLENLDCSIFKNFRFTERLNLQFRGEAFNSMNHPLFGAPNTQVGSLTFGQITSQANAPRQIQFGLKLLF